MTSTSKSLDSSTLTATATETTTNTKPVNKSMFREKLEYDAYRKVIQERSVNIRPKLKYVDYTNVWNIRPVDFTMKLYHPRPPKRNSRDAIKPWEYDKYLKSASVDDLRVAEPKKNAEELMVQAFIDQFGKEEDDEKEDEEFERMFRVVTPNEDRFDMAAKRKAYRAHLDKYHMWKPHDFRGLQPLPVGVPDIQTIFEKDPYNIKFLTEHPRLYFGSDQNASRREVEGGLQMGDEMITPPPHYDPELILPRLPFPNRFYGYTRHRPINRSVQSAFWDRALPKIDEKFNGEKGLVVKNVTTQSTTI